MGHGGREQAGVSRRDLATLFGMFGGAASLATLEACAGTLKQGQPGTAEPMSQAVPSTASLQCVSWIGSTPRIGTDTNLRTIIGANGLVAVAAGFWTPGDGGGGVFVWSSSPVTDDGGTRIVPNSNGDTGATGPGWVRICSGALDAKWFGATGGNATANTTRGSSDDGPSLAAALAAIPAHGGALYLPPGTYAYATSPNFAKANTRVFGEAGTLLACSGPGNALLLDGEAIASGGVCNMTIENLVVRGAGTDTTNSNGVFVRGVHHSRFLNLHVAGAAANAVVVEWCDSNVWIHPIISVNEAAGLTPVPVVGIHLKANDKNLATTYQTFIDPVLQGVNASLDGVGMVIDHAHGITVVGGTINNCPTGVRITANDAQGGGNSFYSTHFESNDLDDIFIANHNTLLSNISAGGVVRVHGASGLANDTCLTGGQIAMLTIESGAHRTSVSDAFIGALNDGGTNTIYRQARNDAGHLPATHVVASRRAAALVRPALASVVTIDTPLGDVFVLTAATPNPVFTIGNPPHPAVGQVITITVKNATGGAMSMTWGTSFRMGSSWTVPPNGFSASVDFYFDGSHWIQKSPAVTTPN
jgi:hypothetical protein